MKIMGYKSDFIFRFFLGNLVEFGILVLFFYCLILEITIWEFGERDCSRVRKYLGI